MLGDVQDNNCLENYDSYTCTTTYMRTKITELYIHNKMQTVTTEYTS